MEPLFKPDYSECGFVRRAFNRFCDALERVAMGAVQASTATLRGELEEGYAEIAEHAARMRQKYPEDYAIADAALRMRHTHLDVEEEEDSFAAVLRSCDAFLARVREEFAEPARADEFEEILDSLVGWSLDSQYALCLQPAAVEHTVSFAIGESGSVLWTAYPCAGDVARVAVLPQLFHRLRESDRHTLVDRLAEAVPSMPVDALREMQVPMHLLAADNALRGFFDVLGIAFQMGAECQSGNS